MTNETAMGDWIEHDPSRGQPVEDDIKTGITLEDGYINQFTHPAKAWNWDPSGQHTIAHFRAPADHPIYKVVEYNKSNPDHPMVYLRQDNRTGKAPDDWDASKPVLFVGRGLSEPGRGLTKTAWLTSNHDWTIIAYTPLRAERASIPAPDKAETGERDCIVRWLREQSDKGADIGVSHEVGTTKRAAYGGGSLALKRAADQIESGEHLTPPEKPVDPVLKLAREICAELWMPGLSSGYLLGVHDQSPAMKSVMAAIQRTEARYTPVVKALTETWRVIDAAGLQNLTHGVQLGQVSWSVKANDARELSFAALDGLHGGEG